MKEVGRKNILDELAELHNRRKNILDELADAKHGRDSEMPSPAMIRTAELYNRIAEGRAALEALGAEMATVTAHRDDLAARVADWAEAAAVCGQTIVKRDQTIAALSRAAAGLEAEFSDERRVADRLELGAMRLRATTAEGRISTLELRLRDRDRRNTERLAERDLVAADLRAQLASTAYALAEARRLLPTGPVADIPRTPGIIEAITGTYVPDPALDQPDAAFHSFIRSRPKHAATRERDVAACPMSAGSCLFFESGPADVLLLSSVHGQTVTLDIDGVKHVIECKSLRVVNVTPNPATST